ncbi:class I SAM-dependent methyltransferase [Terrarubrum flagellatum]|uniref:class I SAM-dependent methyltransferase n=1 Tax=Terrirubrum flagellatum TaxID=2895980 RepID=UPI0031451E06
MTPLHRRIVELIRRDGPIGLDRYMELCLADPEHGYYMTRQPFGARGDFITSPDISQMFGELIGVWMATVWRAMGAPAEIHLVELGPGRGTLMSDALRALRALPGMTNAARVHLVETSPTLREMQQAALVGAPAPISWHETIDALPRAPLIIVANEFFDALPIRQYLRNEDGWRERRIGCDDEGRLQFTPGELTEITGRDEAPPGAIMETSPTSLAIIESLSTRLVADGGAALFIDYGHAFDGLGDTLQAMKAHQYVDVFSTPGEADLTAHVNFAALGEAARKAGAATQGPVTQAAFLHAMGIATRAAALARRATDDQKIMLAAGMARLTDTKNKRAMGRLFRVLAIRTPNLPALPGFDQEPQ